MDKEFVPYEEALELKHLLFNEPCFGYFNTTSYLGVGSFVFKECDENTTDGYGNRPLLRPTFSQAFRWFREKYNLHAEPYTANMGAIEYCFQIRDLYSEKYVYDNFVGAGASYSGTFNTPEEAELACLRKLIEIVKNK